MTSASQTKFVLNGVVQDRNCSIRELSCVPGMDTMIKNKNWIDLTMTSPPYFNVKKYSSWKTYEQYLEFLTEVFTKVHTLTRPGRMCCVNISNIILARGKRSEESRRIPLAFHFVSLMEKIGWIFLEDIIWLKPSGAAKNRNGGFFRHRKPVAYKPNVVNEYLFVFKKQAPFLIDKTLRSWDSQILAQSLVGDDYEKTNVWKISPETRSKHPAPFPQELADKIIKYYSFRGDKILDPFLGSGTTGVVAYLNNRKFIGFEIHSKYVEIATKRIKFFEDYK